MTKTTKQPVQAHDFRVRPHHLTKLPVKDVLKIRMKDLEVKNTDLQKALNYSHPNVIAMMRAGKMRLPPGKVAITAKMLAIDPIFLLGKVVTETDPELWESISSLMADRLVTANEVTLLALIRQWLEGHDVDLAHHPEFVAAVEPVLKTIADRETALAQAALQRKDN